MKSNNKICKLRLVQKTEASGRIFMSRLLAVVIGACLSMAATPTLAAQSVLEEVVVTAQKRSESVLDVPISISVLGGEALDQRSIRNLEDISLATPGLRFDNTFAFAGASVSIRGISSGLGSATTTFYLDDMPLLQRGDDRTSLIVPVVFDLERVEILRGPQGTLYGAGAMGGAIRYITPTPSLDKTSMKISGEYGLTDGGDGAYQVTLVGGAPLVDGKLGFRGGVYYRDEGGWINQATRFTGQIIDKNINYTKTLAIRGSVLWQPTANLSISPSVHYQHGKTGNRDTYWDLDPGFVTRDKFRTPQKSDFILANLKIQYDFDSFTVASITSYTDRKTNLTNDWTETDADALGYDYSADPSWMGVMPWDVSSDAVTQEFRFSSINKGQKLSWQGGLYYQKSKYDLERWEYENLDGWLGTIFGVDAATARAIGAVEIILGVPYLTGPLSGTGIYNDVTYYQHVDRIEKELAGFVNVDYQLTDKLSVGAGGRFAKTEFDNTDTQAGPWIGPLGTVNGKAKESPIIGKFNVDYHITDDSMVYFTWAQGYRLGGANQDFSSNALCVADLAAQGGKNPLTYKSDKLDSFELGTKNTFLGNRIFLTASVYRINWTDIQRQVGLPTCLNYYTDNLGQAEVTGIDLDFEMKLNEYFRLSMAWGYNNGEYSKDTVIGGNTYALKGQDFEQPKIVGNTSLYYNGTFNNYDTYATLSVDYNGPYKRGVPAGVVGYTVNELAIRDAESVTVANFRAGIGFGNWTAGVFIENLLDSHDTVGQFLTASGRTNVTSRGLRPRVVGLSLDYQY